MSNPYFRSLQFPEMVLEYVDQTHDGKYTDSPWYFGYVYIDDVEHIFCGHTEEEAESSYQRYLLLLESTKGR
jgi:hypothetical protein